MKLKHRVGGLALFGVFLLGGLFFLDLQMTGHRILSMASFTESFRGAAKNGSTKGSALSSHTNVQLELRSIRPTLDARLQPNRTEAWDATEAFSDLSYHCRKLRKKNARSRPNLFLMKQPSGDKPRKNKTLWKRFHEGITQNELYPENDTIINPLLKEMSTRPIVFLEQKEGGTQLKLIIRLDNGAEGLVKFMRFPRGKLTEPNHFYFSDYERHISEIAAYHLDRIFGVRQAPPVVGRLFNITSEIFPLAKGSFLKTFFVSPANNICFHGKCSYYCDTGHAICGTPDVVEGSIAVMLPDMEEYPRAHIRNPWRRSYNKRRQALWENDPDFCKEVKVTPPYNETTRLLDLLDLTIFDFFIGNMDRHHYEMFEKFEDTGGLPVRLDHGRGFGKPHHDEMSILTPLVQCCNIRLSTLEKLLHFHNSGTKFSQIMRESLARDPLQSILLEPQLEALDRRLYLVLKTIRKCVTDKSASQVILQDDF